MIFGKGNFRSFRVFTLTHISQTSKRNWIWSRNFVQFDTILLTWQNCLKRLYCILLTRQIIDAAGAFWIENLQPIQPNTLDYFSPNSFQPLLQLRLKTEPSIQENVLRYGARCCLTPNTNRYLSDISGIWAVAVARGWQEVPGVTSHTFSELEPRKQICRNNHTSDPSSNLNLF